MFDKSVLSQLSIGHLFDDDDNMFSEFTEIYQNPQSVKRLVSVSGFSTVNVRRVQKSF